MGQGARDWDAGGSGVILLLIVALWFWNEWQEDEQMLRNRQRLIDRAVERVRHG